MVYRIIHDNINLLALFECEETADTYTPFIMEQFTTKEEMLIKINELGLIDIDNRIPKENGDN